MKKIVQHQILSKEAKEVLKYYHQTILEVEVAAIGKRSSIVPLYEGEVSPIALRDYSVHYPQSLIDAYKMVCDEYDHAFMELVEKHKDWDTDYQYAPYNLAFQVDGPAYPAAFLSYVKNISPQILAEVVKVCIYECENNIALYGLNGRLWPNGTSNTTWHATLDIIRKKTGKKIAVLAGTEEKLDEILLSELGTDRNNISSEERIRSLTGFDVFMGPTDLKAEYKKYKGEKSDYLFYGRTSRPKTWLRSPSNSSSDEFSANLDILKYIRAFALTHNFDKNLPINDKQVITDTKEPLVTIGAGYLVMKPSDIYSSEFLDFLASTGVDEKDIIEGTLPDYKRNKLGKFFINFPFSKLLSQELISHLLARGANPELIANGTQEMRAKPMKLHYGVYGHVVGRVNRASFLNDLAQEIRIRGAYILQPEFSNMLTVDSKDQSTKYLTLDRIFFVRASNGQLQPMESARLLVSTNTPEGRKKSIHNSPYTLDARIIMGE